jgi:four helix bundle protein
MTDGMGVRLLKDLRAFQEAEAFKLAVYQIARDSPLVQRDFRFREQLMSSTASVQANIAEGWRRSAAPDFIRFLRYSRASLEEAELWLRDGVQRGHYAEAVCADAFARADRCGRLITALRKSLEPFVR